MAGVSGMSSRGRKLSVPFLGLLPLSLLVRSQNKCGAAQVASVERCLNNTQAPMHTLCCPDANQRQSWQILTAFLPAQSQSAPNQMPSSGKPLSKTFRVFSHPRWAVWREGLTRIMGHHYCFLCPSQPLMK